MVREDLEEKRKENLVLENVSDNETYDDNSCDKLEEKDKSESQTSDKDVEEDYLEHLESPKAESDEETPEHISDFLNQLNETALKTNNNEDSKPDDDCPEDHSFHFEIVPEDEDTFNR